MFVPTGFSLDIDQKDKLLRPTFAEVNLTAIVHNLRAIREHLGPSVSVWGVIKADAYGHGAIAVARALGFAGCAGLCVALVEEGLELRAANIDTPILVMSGTHKDGLREAVFAGLIPVIYDPSQLDYATRLPPGSIVHLKIDTGLSRQGITAKDLPRVATALASMKNVQVQGLMTHMANSDLDDATYTETQLGRFEQAYEIVRKSGLSPTIRHTANSATAFRFPQSHYEMVRPGIALYGVAPFPHNGPALLPAFRLRTEITALREIHQGDIVGYGGAFVAKKDTIVATIPIGYADGFFRRLSSQAQVLINGQRASVIGNVAMDMTMVDVTTIAHTVGVSVGDEVVLLGAQSGTVGTDVILAEETAARIGTIPYEVLCAVSRRVPRRYSFETKTTKGT